jgi:hypothetical protein
VAINRTGWFWSLMQPATYAGTQVISLFTRHPVSPIYEDKLKPCIHQYLSDYLKFLVTDFSSIHIALKGKGKAIPVTGGEGP